jgi:hypothetical protein
MISPNLESILDLSKPLIINTELFLQCHGHCAGCFLTEAERIEENTYLNKIRSPILELLRQSESYSHVILGFGRGNLLNLSDKSLRELLSLMEECEALVPKEKITYELSTSLIGKIDSQIEKAAYLLDRNRNIYFNVVINSEITSKTFWSNWEKIYNANSNLRKSWGMTDNYSDILVLNINPQILPDLDFIEKYVSNQGLPFNISLFPFSGNEVSNEDLLTLNNWSVKLWEKFQGKDLNIKNYLETLKRIDIGNDLTDIISYHESNKNAYYFIDKNGEITPGSLSIMGEVDYVRLVNKFNTDPDPKKALTLMQKTKPCNMCEYQKECILSGAYLNMVNNSHKIKGAKHCLSGYAPIFELSANSHIPS